MTDVFGTYEETPVVGGDVFDLSDHEFDTPMLEEGQYRLKINGMKLIIGSQTGSKTHLVKFTVLAHRVEDEWVTDNATGQDLEVMFNLVKGNGESNARGVGNFNSLLKAIGRGDTSLYASLSAAKKEGKATEFSEADVTGWVIEGRVVGKPNPERGDVTYNLYNIVPHLDDTETRVRL